MFNIWILLVDFILSKSILSIIIDKECILQQGSN